MKGHKGATKFVNLDSRVSCDAANGFAVAAIRVPLKRALGNAEWRTRKIFLDVSLRDYALLVTYIKFTHQLILSSHMHILRIVAY